MIPLVPQPQRHSTRVKVLDTFFASNLPNRVLGSLTTEIYYHLVGLSQRNDRGADHDLSLNSSMDGSMDRIISRPTDRLIDGQDAIFILGSE